MIIIAVLPALKALTEAVKSYDSTAGVEALAQSTMLCSAAMDSGLVSRGVKFLACGVPLMSLPPMLANLVYQSTRNIETSPDLATIVLPATPPVLSFATAAWYSSQVVGTEMPAEESRSLR